MAATSELVEVTDHAEWDALVERSPGSFFSQLWEWGEVQRSINWHPRRLMLPDHRDGEPDVAAAQVLVHRLPGIGWSVGHAPRGPLATLTSDSSRRFVAALRAWARRNRICTLIVDPPADKDSELGRLLLGTPWRRAPALGEPICHVLDLAPGVDPWPNVHRKHREWIRRAEKAGVDVAWADASSTAAEAEASIRHFQDVYEQLAERLRIRVQRPEYYAMMWDRFRATGRAHVATATHRGKVVGSMLHLVCGDEMVWFAGGQTEAGNRVGAGKLLVWRSVLRARDLGMRRYNMWGTATSGLARYKEGFGARQETYVGTRAMPVYRPADVLVQAAWRLQQVSRRALRRH